MDRRCKIKATAAFYSGRRLRTPSHRWWVMPRFTTLVALLAAVAAPSLHAQAAGPARGRVPLERRGLCGDGMFQFKLGGTAIGQETFQVNCLPTGGYAAGGRTELALPSATINVATTVTLDSALMPMVVTAQGTSGTAAVDQRVEFGDTIATVTAGAQTRKAVQARGAAWLGSNIYYSIPFIVARYDAGRGGVQMIPTFPALPVTVQREGTDRVRASDTSAAVTRSFERYALRVGQERVVAWLDSGGKMALLSVPSQEFRAVRRGFEPFEAALARSAGESGDGRSATTTDYSAPPDAPYSATEVQIPVGGYVLAGTLLMPKEARGPRPAVVLITGSGQQTRDETLPIAGLEEYRPFRQIAEALASAGFAVLRVDDRGAGLSSGGGTVGQATTRDFANDTRAQVAWLRARRDVNPGRVTLVGHSEGAIIASQVAAADPRIAGVVMMAGPGKRGEAVLTAQLEDLLARDTVLTREQKEAARTKQHETFKGVRTRHAVAGGANPGEAWLREFLTYDPLATVRQVRQPLLILQGERDRQVDAENATLLAGAAQGAGNPDVTVRVLPGLNHLFLPAETGAVTEYPTLESKRIGEDVLGVLRDWLLAHNR